MPSNRRLRIVGIIAFVCVLTLVYITTGARNTYDSQFYTRTVEAIKTRQEVEARQNLIAETKQQQERVERVEKEHNAAVSKAAAAAQEKNGRQSSEEQPPLDAGAEQGGAPSEKSVAGRKKMKDGRVVENKPATDVNDGVAKVGNAEAVKSHKSGPETEADHKTDDVMNEILKKGPIIVFSKSYCPHSKKAKHILLDLYTINPPPHVVELDLHEIGGSLQASLGKTTGRRTVPNVLISGKSIGGGDEIEKLHREGKLAETISSMGGKRIVEVKAKDPA